MSSLISEEPPTPPPPLLPLSLMVKGKDDGVNGGEPMQFEGVSRSHLFAFVNQNPCWLIFILYVKKKKKFNSFHVCVSVFRKKKKKHFFFLKSNV